MKIILTREAGKNDELRRLLPSHHDIIDVPLTATEFFPIPDVETQLRASKWYGHFESLVATSARVDRYAGLVEEAMASHFEVFTVGRTSQQVLDQHGLIVTHRSDGGAEELNRYITHNPVLLLGAEEMREELTIALRKRGLDVEHIKCYRTLPVAPTAEQQALLQSADVVAIGAPSTWTVAQPYVSESTWVVVPGATTAAEVTKSHERVVVGWDQRFPEALLAFEE